MVTEELSHRLQHRGACLCGGFLGGSALLEIAGTLGNAQTMNLIELVLALLGGDIRQVLLRLIAFALYFAAAMLFVWVRDVSPWSPKTVSLLITALAAVVLALIADTAPTVVRLWPIFFAMSFQWNAFPGAYGYQSSSIFSTNNTRQVGLSLAEYLIGHDEKKLHKARFFLGSLLCFHIGVAISWCAVHWLGRFAPLGVWPLLILTALTLRTEPREVCA